EWACFMAPSDTAAITASRCRLVGRGDVVDETGGQPPSSRGGCGSVGRRAAREAIPALMGWLAGAATLGLAIAAVAQEPTEAPSGDRWSLSVAPYLWAAAMDGHATV